MPVTTTSLETRWLQASDRKALSEATPAVGAQADPAAALATEVALAETGADLAETGAVGMVWVETGVDLAEMEVDLAETEVNLAETEVDLAETEVDLAEMGVADGAVGTEVLEAEDLVEIAGDSGVVASEAVAVLCR